MPRAIITAVLLLPSFLIAQNSGTRDTWESFRCFVGSWEGTGKGQLVSKTQREYKFVLNGKFFPVQNRSVGNAATSRPRLRENKGQQRPTVGC